MMSEAQRVAEKLWASRFKITLDQRIAGAEAVGAHKTSMLQDVEHGRALELAGPGGRGRRAGAHHRHADADDRRHLRATALLAKTLADRRGRLEMLPA